MRVGSLVARGGVTTSFSLGLVLEKITGVTFDEVLVVWFNPYCVANRSLIKTWEPQGSLRVITR